MSEGLTDEGAADDLAAPYACPRCGAPFWSRLATCRGRMARMGKVGADHLAHDPARVVPEWELRQTDNLSHRAGRG